MLKIKYSIDGKTRIEVFKTDRQAEKFLFDLRKQYLESAAFTEGFKEWKKNVGKYGGEEMYKRKRLSKKDRNKRDALFKEKEAVEFLRPSLKVEIEKA